MDKVYLDVFIENALAEDIGRYDITSHACIPSSAKGKAKLLVKEEGVLAGVEVAKRVLEIVDKELTIQVFIPDGSLIKKGDIAFVVEGSVLSILAAERLVLNVMQRMSGIATNTRRYVDRLEGLHTKVLDTRKTTPGLRVIEKAAVRIGGGENHRMGLFDMILIKDNHIDFAGGIQQAIEASNEYIMRRRLDVKIEIEARSISDIQTILSIGKVNRIMLDNFTVEQTCQAVKLIAGRFETESSGGITLDTIREYAECGVDYVSVGALTHHVKSLDLSLKALF